MGLILVIIMACAASISLMYYVALAHYFNLDTKQEPIEIDPINLLGVSVIISSKNAGDNVFTLATQLLQQDYPLYEVIIINDFSSDHSFELLKTISNDKLVLLQADADIPGKKYALTQAIEKATFPVLLFTDADCLPNSDQWIKRMQTCLTSSDANRIVLGYGPLYNQKNIVSNFSRFETFLTAFQYIGYAAAGLPYMGVGRNLMYYRSVFFESGGFEGHAHIASGDDDLFVHRAATPHNVAICYDPDTFMYSAPKSDIWSFLHQKSRHISTATHYRPLIKILLAFFSASHILFYSSLIGIFLFYYQWIGLPIVIYLTKILIQMVCCSNAMKKLDAKDLIAWFPIMDFLLFIYYLILPFVGIFRKNRW